MKVVAYFRSILMLYFYYIFALCAQNVRMQVRPHRSVRMFQLYKRLTAFDQTWYGYYTIGVYSKSVHCNILYRFGRYVGHSSRTVYSMNYLRSLGRWDRGFESHSRHGYLVCVCVHSVFMLSCVQITALRRADHSSKESYRLWK
jgi:hypothetical protein